MVVTHKQIKYEEIANKTTFHIITTQQNREILGNTTVAGEV